MKVDINKDIMATNNAYAAENRDIFTKLNVFVVNIMGSPGAGKTSLLERTLTYLQQHLKVAVIEGDLATAKDAARIAACGVPVIQINTDGGCHLDAKMISQVLPGFDLADLDMMVIENVGNLVCPASFDLGEDMRVVVMSITEGGDKPSKYPTAFLTSDIAVLNKMDIKEHIDIDIEATKADIIALNPKMKIYECSCRPGQICGVDDLSDYLIELVKAKSKRI